ncbi:tetratricopeptide repeat protein [Haliangium ochraceum]|uniref:tetratricopeptide repeat protein n=1 Tax=Haliangium ochraceum TaxID=80816 RepID=UPI0018EFFDC0|nr:HEAT repeat domain-containing protein [Haliangium ochraceum]
MLPPASALAQGDWSVRRDPFDRKVIARYKAILARNPGDRGALRKLIQLYSRHRTLDLLVREYQRAVAQAPKDADAAVVLGHLHLHRGERALALAEYERARQLAPESVPVLLAIAALQRQQGALAEARGAYQQALPGVRGKAAEREVVLALAELAVGAGDAEAAAGHYQRYFALAPRDIDARVAWAEALAQLGRHDDAIAALRETIGRLRADPARQIELLTRIGVAHEAAGRDTEAVEVYREALARAGNITYLRRELVARIIENHRRRQALPALITSYEQAWPKNRRGYFEWDVLGRLYEETGNQDQAIEALRAALRKAPYELETQRRLIALLETTGREDEALAQYEAAIRVAPGEPRFQLELAERYWRRGREAQALEILARVGRRFAGDGAVHTAIADLYTRWGKADLALQSYERLARIEPEEPSHLVNLGEQYHMRGDTKQAMAVWRRIIARKTPANYARLGEVFAEHNQLDEALRMYEKAIQMEPEQAAHYKGRAGVFERRRDWQSVSRAVDDWNKVLALLSNKDADKPARAEARRRIVSLLKRGPSSAMSKAKASWQRDFWREPADVEAGYLLVEAYLRDNKFNSAERELQRLLKLDPKDTEALELLAKVAERTYDYDAAVAHLERLAELSPNRRRDYFNRIAELKTADRKDDEALEYARRALEASPNDPLAYERLAERYVEMQRFDEATEAYAKTIELDPRQFRAYFALALLHTHNHEPERAAELYREVLRRASDEQILARAGREAIDLEEMMGSLGELERLLAPLSFTYAHKQVYRRVLVELYGRYVPALVRRASDGPARERQRARAELERLGAHGLKPLLEALSDDTDVHQQRTAVAVLGYLGNKGAAAPLIRLAQEVPGKQRGAAQRALTPVLEWNVRLDALIAAARLGDAQVIDELVALTEREGKDAFREAALFGLGRTGARAAIAPLSRALSSDSTADLTLACLGLAQLVDETGDRRPLSAIGELVGDARRSDVARGACAFALGYVHRGAPRPEVTATLVSALGSGNGTLPQMAAWALGLVGGADASGALLRAYPERSEPVRRVIHWALVHAAGPAAGGDSAERGVDAADFGHYPRGLDDRYAAAAALGQMLDERQRATVPGALAARLLAAHEAELAAAVRTALGGHRDRVVRVLGDLDGAADHLTMGALTRELADAPAAQRGAARAALARLGQAVLPAVAALAQHRDAEVRSLVLSVAAKIDSPRGQALVLAGLEDAQPAVRRAALRAATEYLRLHERGGEALAQAVAAQLADGDWEVRTAAAQAMGLLGAAARAEALADAVGDENAYVRESATRALGRVAGGASADARAAIEAGLLAASADELPIIRAAAAQGLGRVGSRRARERLQQMAAQDSSEQVADAAQRQLGERQN